MTETESLTKQEKLVVKGRLSDAQWAWTAERFKGWQGPRTLVSYLYPSLIPQEELDRFDLRLNFHPAPLPDYRGFAPYTFGILNEEREWGVSCHHMTGEIDGGPLVKVARFPISEPETVTAESLRAQTLPWLARLYEEVMERIMDGETLAAQEQGEGAYYSRDDFEAIRLWPSSYKREIPTDTLARAFWCPPHAGWGWVLPEPDGQHHTIAPLCVAGGTR